MCIVIMRDRHHRFKCIARLKVCHDVLFLDLSKSEKMNSHLIRNAHMRDQSRIGTTMRIVEDSLDNHISLANVLAMFANGHSGSFNPCAICALDE